MCQLLAFFGLQLPFEKGFFPGVGSYPGQHREDFFSFIVLFVGFFAVIRNSSLKVSPCNDRGILTRRDRLGQKNGPRTLTRIQGNASPFQAITIRDCRESTIEGCGIWLKIPDSRFLP